MDSKFNTRLTPLVLGLLIVGLTACGGGGGSGDSGPAAAAPQQTASSWESVNSFALGLYVHSKSDQVWITGFTDRSVHYSDNGGHAWQTFTITPLYNALGVIVTCQTTSGRLLTHNGYSDDGLASIEPYLLIGTSNSDHKTYCADSDVMLRAPVFDTSVTISTDQGTSWENYAFVKDTGLYRYSHSFTPTRTRHKTFFLPSKTGLLRSTQQILNGTLQLSWTNLELSGPVSSLVYNPQTDELTGITLHGDILRSTDDGLTWQTISSVADFIDLDGDYYSYTLATLAPIITLSEDGELAVIGAVDEANNPTNPTLKTPVFRSMDNGKHWTSLPEITQLSTVPSFYISDDYYWFESGGIGNHHVIRLAR